MDSLLPSLMLCHQDYRPYFLSLKDEFDQRTSLSSVVARSQDLEDTWSQPLGPFDTTITFTKFKRYGLNTPLEPQLIIRTRLATPHTNVLINSLSRGPVTRPTIMVTAPHRTSPPTVSSKCHQIRLTGIPLPTSQMHLEYSTH